MLDVLSYFSDSVEYIMCRCYSRSAAWFSVENRSWKRT